MAMFKDQYRRLKELGAGAYGAAYLVQRRDDKEVFHVAKSVKLPDLSEREKQAALMEVECLKKVMHPNVIAYVSCFLEERKLHIIMEYADRGDLAKKILRRREANKAISESSILRYFLQLALALEHIHSLNILHRDVKPMNIFLVGDEEQVKLGDFGIARLVDGDAVGAECQVGTPHYLPPEVINERRYSTSGELWSLGVVLYELMALRVPFTGQSLPAVAIQICGATPAALPQSYSAALRSVARDLLDKEPERRPSLNFLLRAPTPKGAAAACQAGGAPRCQQQQQQQQRLQQHKLQQQMQQEQHGEDAWPALTQRHLEKLRRQHASSNFREDSGSQGEPSGSSTSTEAAKAPTPPNPHQFEDSDEKWQALESARLDALQDRRVARERALFSRGGSDGPTSSAASTLASVLSSRPAVIPAGGGRGTRSQDYHLEALARASRDAAQMRRNSAASSIISNDAPNAIPQSARSSIASNENVAFPYQRRRSLDFTPEYRQSLAQASMESAQERRQIREKLERGEARWAGNDKLVACA
eukprot:CAMPEP_0206525980 /NCGR_PEP_ID=MMETSP0325_2-20121206/412_1 /ASSEMBLY_ACC=CAM_ASM_000347 /TAXON_ID=2866 /ORGANISM="Crypthecodinium cohnii, Strain Seligo" /LENGTH=533 /DNA_ID=CAMNT_0054020975 /DNA_START=47 /DNA_END=1648 /DNA_ORIENTATION=-